MNYWLSMIIRIISILAGITLIYFLGVRGIVGYMFGVIFMTYLFSSNNQLLLLIVKYFGSDQNYMDEILKK